MPAPRAHTFAGPLRPAIPTPVSDRYRIFSAGAALRGPLSR